ncbi:MAG: hypothetical protein HYX29_11780 [Solirubrobacterales bacterium]|nr:hypothetical protein [Solirubrobacterales bacterium]
MYRHEENTPDKMRVRSEFFLLGVLLGSVLLAFVTGSPSVLLFGGFFIVAVGLWYFRS